MNRNEEFLQRARDTPIHWPGTIKRIIDDYRSRGADYIHGNQKDAIQNMVDALDPNSNEKAKFIIRLVEDSKIPMLILEDYGTTGLTGRVLELHEMTDDLDEEERWARFESLSFSKSQTSQTLGARGQGKFMLLTASADVKITPGGVKVDDNKPPWLYYDTRRKDGVYRYGKRIVQTNQSLVDCWDDDRGKTELKLDLGIEPIDHIGSRIIIPNPKKAIIEAIKDGTYAEYIAVTWFPLLKEKNNLIRLEYDGKQRIVKADDRLDNIPKDDEEKVKVWRKKEKIKFQNRFEYDVELVMAGNCQTDEIISDEMEELWADEDIRHVNIYRGNMQIMSVDNRMIPQKIMNRIFGYVKVDKQLEAKLQVVEDATHYHLNLDKGPGKKLRQFIEREILNFSREKLGYDDFESHEHDERDRSIQRNVLNQLNEMMRKLGFEGDKGPKPVIVDENNKPKPRPDLDIEVRRIEFPTSGIRRVNYGESLENIGCTVKNDTLDNLEGRVIIETKIGKETVDVLYDESTTIESLTKFSVADLSAEIDEENYYSPGKYSLSCSFITSGKGYKKVNRKRPFWVQDNEPSNGFFEDFDYKSFEGTGHENKTAYATQLGDRNWKLDINITHPGWIRNAGGDQDWEEDYNMRAALPWVLFIDAVENDIDERQLVEFDIDDKTIMNLIDCMGVLEKQSWMK